MQRGMPIGWHSHLRVVLGRHPRRSLGQEQAASTRGTCEAKSTSCFKHLLALGHLLKTSANDTCARYTRGSGLMSGHLHRSASPPYAQTPLIAVTVFSEVAENNTPSGWKYFTSTFAGHRHRSNLALAPRQKTNESDRDKFMHRVVNVLQVWLLGLSNPHFCAVQSLEPRSPLFRCGAFCSPCLFSFRSISPVTIHESEK